ncbi:GDP-mannose-dependent alpha-mannosyltransferase [Candidatus Filomicrobium marinum]|uniref:GDP-mannose-dependent alpha-mannosyltransferase n=1 Tax=Candidatus Filomicrobium marinum TaxID=1608628 RepID=A0A0D6JEL2_9HYPH|nr:glycosyltransferase family 1 protein [Candidatus Filomicrobium marinum]CFX19868.1 GDP-mannose-dependent alpha-mannosyltransferase [Candidatus Filomicrobium marinum]CPR18570.1 GDP-mannose-dependent alpha-mannosyltransferase [Candidatus Filomicrobium marinum]
MKILIATDAWRPQVNGVVRTYERLAEEAAQLDVELTFLTPAEFQTWPCPTYPEIRLALPGYAYIIERMKLIRPDAVHIATEGPLGWMTRSHCIRRGVPFTTSFHTRFPDYLSRRFGIPESWIWSILRRFHNAGAGIMVATPSLATELDSRGFDRIMPWTRGVDTHVFRPRNVRRFGEGPVFLYVGRVAVEKNIEAFLRTDLPGKKVVVGSGPQFAELRVKYPDVTFTGKQIGEDLAECYASADVFVMPSQTETFGIVLLEAMASGLPVAAYPVTGPLDLVRQAETGFLSEDLAAAAKAAMSLDRDIIRKRALDYSWEAAARLFIANIETALFARLGQGTPKRRVTLARPASSA